MPNWSKIKRESAPINPNFCPVIDEDTEKKCNNFMRNWDLHYYQQYGMCEECFKKYNSHVEEIAAEWKRQTEE